MLIRSYLARIGLSKFDKANLLFRDGKFEQAITYYQKALSNRVPASYYAVIFCLYFRGCEA